MLKNKMKFILLLIVMILALTMPIVNATENDVMLINEEPESSENATSNTTGETTDSKESFKKSDIYLKGDDITIDYIVDGNLFILANNVTINSQIGGDAFICADNITIGEQGYIFSNLFALSDNVEIKGVVYDLYASSQNVKISGYIYRDVHIDCNWLELSGTIGRNAFVNCKSLTFGQSNTDESNTQSVISGQGMINGNLTYSSSTEASIPEGIVTGEVNFTKGSSVNIILLFVLIPCICIIIGLIATILGIVLIICYFIKKKKQKEEAKKD